MVLFSCLRTGSFNFLALKKKSSLIYINWSVLFTLAKIPPKECMTSEFIKPYCLL